MSEHTFKAGDKVTVFAMTFGGRYIIEGRAKIVRPVKDIDEQYVVNFLDKDGRQVRGERYERFVDPAGQADPEAHVKVLNRYESIREKNADDYCGRGDYPPV